MIKASLKAACSTRRLDEKWLVAGSQGCARQWVEGVAREGGAVVNCRAHTVGSLAGELAGVRAASELACEMIVRRVFGKVGGKYLGGAVGQVWRTVAALRLAGVSGKQVARARFEVADKGKELGRLLEGYERELDRRGLVDRAGVLELALKAAKALDVVLLVPEDLEVSGLEKRLLEALPAGQKVVLGVEHGTAEVLAFRAAGEANEARHVVRTCVERGWALDDVEVLYTDVETYVPLFFELGKRFGFEVTFAEGVPARYSRVGRAFLGWLAWRRAGYPASVFARLLRDGLLGHEGMARVLASLGVGFGRARYAERIGAEVLGLEARLAAGEMPKDRLQSRLETCRKLAGVVEAVLDVTPEGSTAADVLDGAARFVDEVAAGAGELDDACRAALGDEIRELRRALEGGEDFDPWEWLEELARDTRLAQHSPRPGCLHVASLAAGGQSGRTHTFVLGLDDGRFPGAGLQDPLLLDGERGGLSPELPLEGERPTRKRERLTRVLAGLSGVVTLSYPCRDLAEGRELFPCAAFVAACREAWGAKDLGLKELRARLGPPVAFVAEDRKRCLDEADWWLHRLVGRRLTRAAAAVGQRFPHLDDGWKAEAARASDTYTAWDGLVGPDPTLDPTSGTGPVPSPSGLVQLGTCARRYFYDRVLGIRPPDELEVDPAVWLDPMQAGTLLHEVFRRFLEGMGKERPKRKHRKRLARTLAVVVAEWRQEVPPPGEAPYEVQVERFVRTCDTFLAAEEEFCKTSAPSWFEVPIGTAPEGPPGPLDSAAPAQIPLKDGRMLRVRGRLDRIDQTATGYAVWDYKTGKLHDEYYLSPRASQGAQVQHAAYRFMAEERLRAVVDPGATVEVSGYFFPSPEGAGQRVGFGAAYRDEELEVLGELADVAAAGAFPATDVKKKGIRICAWCDWLPLCGDYEAVVCWGRAKVESRKNPSLAAWRKLRGA